MWKFVRTVLFAFALAGFAGQSMVDANPFPVFEATGGLAGMDCAESMMMADGAIGGAINPCHEMAPECIAKLGCTAVVMLIPATATLVRPEEPRAIWFPAASIVREGASPLPLKNPPKPLA